MLVWPITSTGTPTRSSFFSIFVPLHGCPPNRERLYHPLLYCLLTYRYTWPVQYEQSRDGTAWYLNVMFRLEIGSMG